MHARIHIMHAHMHSHIQKHMTNMHTSAGQDSKGHTSTTNWPQAPLESRPLAEDHRTNDPTPRS